MCLTEDFSGGGAFVGDRGWSWLDGDAFPAQPVPAHRLTPGDLTGVGSLGGSYWRIPVSLPGQRGDHLLVTRRDAIGSACGPVRRSCGETLTLRLGWFGDLGASSIQLWVALTEEQQVDGVAQAGVSVTPCPPRLPPPARDGQATAWTLVWLATPPDWPPLEIRSLAWPIGALRGQACTFTIVDASIRGGWLLDAIIDQ
jgi:hypothetical protein